MPSHDNPNPIDRYLTTAKAILRIQLPNDRVESVLSEARDHMEQHAESLIGEGKSVNEAQLAAVKAFGGAWRWTYDVTNAFYSEGQSKYASWVIGVFYFICGMCIPYCSLAVYGHAANLMFPALTVATLSITIMVASFLFRKYLLKSAAFFAIVLCLSLYLTSGLLTVNSPSGHLENKETAKYIVSQQLEVISQIKNELHVLKLGKRYFIDSNAAGIIPKDLQTNSGYIMPTLTNSDGYLPSDQRVIFYKDQDACVIPWKRPFQDGRLTDSVLQTVSNADTAKALWQKADLATRIKFDEAWTDANVQNYYSSRLAEVSKPGFNFRAYSSVAVILPIIIIVFIVHMLGVCLGRFFYQNTFRSKTALPA